MFAAFQNTPDAWGQASNGETGVFGSPSGMVGETNNVGAWYIYKAKPGVQYIAHYWGGDVEVQNLGDGSYLLRVGGGEITRHMYDARWDQGTFFDAAGRAVPHPADLAYSGEPQGVYAQPGARLAMLTEPAPSSPLPIATSPAATTPGTVTPAPAPSPITGQPPETVAAPFPVVEQSALGSGSALKLALGALALFSFLK